MLQKTQSQIFKEWIATATIEELDEELLNLEEIGISMISQIEKYDLKIKTEDPSQEDQDWRLRISHSSRWTRCQINAVQRRILALKQKFNAEARAENVRLASGSSKLKYDRITSYEHAWVEAALKILHEDTLSRISTAAKESLESADRQLEKQ